MRLHILGFAAALIVAGSTGVLKRATTFPSRPIRNFSKFQPIFPLNPGFDSSEVRNLYSGAASSPTWS